MHEKGGTFLLKRALFLITAHVRGGEPCPRGVARLLKWGRGGDTVGIEEVIFL
jgi:hypothetical protein